jgi:glycosyltransferase involved in cell wall biosynthesis
MARILHVLPAFLPATLWGGPVFSTAAMCRAGAGPGRHRVRVLTTDAQSPVSRSRLDLSENPARFDPGFEVHYARRAFGRSGSWEMLARLPAMVAEADLVHLSMSYSFPTLPTILACRLLRKPLVWSPRGAIQATEEWPDAPRKGVKRAFERLARWMLPRDTVLHVTSQAEARATARRMPGVAIRTIPNCVELPSRPVARRFRPAGQLRLVHLGRLHPKKGLEILIEALACLPDHITLTVAGGGAPEYETALANRVRALGLAHRVAFLGHVEGAAKRHALAAADAFVSPTLSENFGIAIAEALASGLPVVTTRAAPWAEIERYRCGLWIEPGQAPLAAALRAMDACSGDDLAACGIRGQRLVSDQFSETVVGARLVALYAECLGGGSIAGGVEMAGDRDRPGQNADNTREVAWHTRG